ncbi:MAG: hypothetical protein NVS3B5_12930 [Sphingomicrobium sp.]
MVMIVSNPDHRGSETRLVEEQVKLVPGQAPSTSVKSARETGGERRVRVGGGQAALDNSSSCFQLQMHLTAFDE